MLRGKIRGVTFNCRLSFLRLQVSNSFFAPTLISACPYWLAGIPTQERELVGWLVGWFIEKKNTKILAGMKEREFITAGTVRKQLCLYCETQMTFFPHVLRQTNLNEVTRRYGTRINGCERMQSSWRSAKKWFEAALALQEAIVSLSQTTGGLLPSSHEPGCWRTLTPGHSACSLVVTSETERRHSLSNLIQGPFPGDETIAWKSMFMTP